VQSKKEREKIKEREGERCPLVPLYFSSLSLLRTALHYLNAWNRLECLLIFRCSFLVVTFAGFYMLYFENALLDSVLVTSVIDLRKSG